MVQLHKPTTWKGVQEPLVQKQDYCGQMLGPAGGSAGEVLSLDQSLRPVERHFNISVSSGLVVDHLWFA